MVLEENKGDSEEFSDSDDDELEADREAVNPLKDFTFIGAAKPKKKATQPKKLDSITTIRDYLETELGQERLY